MGGSSNAASFAVHQHAMEVQRINSLIKERFEQNDIPQEPYRFALMFVVGKASTLFYKELLENEVNNYGDILVADFEDTYKNLTLKNLAGLRYVLVACPEVPAVLKMDDDVAWNMEKAAMLANFTAVTNKIHCAL
ncbi:hypothetical protein ANCCAN_11701 [Ancylostoma caninum]|uniref:Hexosyltransferase n=1 Tax=Ancylostoma caninum TaxID=29170 RepID=A0A368GH09_ANCCA|nr:hypothetical protein ANCCAN_11701 [Ancylostoma caninum]